MQWRPTGYSRPTSTDESPASAVGEAAVAADGGGAASAVGEAAVAADGGGVADAVNVQRVPGGVEPCPCPLDDADGPDEDDEKM